MKRMNEEAADKMYWKTQEDHEREAKILREIVGLEEQTVETIKNHRMAMAEWTRANKKTRDIEAAKKQEDK